ncbi:MAG: hypothetical protein AAF728_06250 [Cyanobacteria bacterium P01_D01_bin.128]
MATSEQIKQHLAISSSIKLENTTPVKGDDARKARIMEHIKKSKG